MKRGKSRSQNNNNSVYDDQFQQRKQVRQIPGINSPNKKTSDQKIGSFFQRLSKRTARVQLWGYKAANTIHRGFVTGVLVFISYNFYRFLTDYNDYWKLRRDSTVPKQWLAKKKQVGSQDWALESQRQARNFRLSLKKE